MKATRERATIGLAVCLMAAVAVVGTVEVDRGAASAATTETVEEAELVTTQSQSAAASLIQEFADASLVDTGFTSVVFEDQGLAVLWAGQPPQAFVATLAAARVLAPVRLVSADFSARSVDDKVRALIKYAATTDVQINPIGPNNTYDAINVGVPKSQYERAVGLLPSYSSSVAPTDLGIEILPDDNVAVPAATRRADTSAFYGGSAVRVSGETRTCSMGFTAVRPGSSATAMVSARHCGRGERFDTYSTGVRVGTGGAGDADTDSMFVDGEEYAPRIYTGAWDSTANRAVTGAGNPSRLETICSSGAFEGVHCNVQVESVNQYARVEGYGLVGPGFWSSNRDRDGAEVQPIGGPGDSGSPMFVYANDEKTRVHIRGLFDAIDPSVLVPCDGPLSTRGCSYRAFSINVAAIRTALSVNVLTQ